jgi:hypothetical protein
VISALAHHAEKERIYSKWILVRKNNRTLYMNKEFGAFENWFLPMNNSGDDIDLRIHRFFVIVVIFLGAESAI